MQLSIRTAAYFIDFNKKRDQSLHLEPFTEPTPHDFEETLTFLRAKYYDRKCFKMTLKTISKILRSNISQTIVAALKISGGVLFNSDVLARLQTSRHSPAQSSQLRENIQTWWKWSSIWRLALMVKALATAHLPTMSGGLLLFLMMIWVIARSLPLCPLSL